MTEQERKELAENLEELLEKNFSADLMEVDETSIERDEINNVTFALFHWEDWDSEDPRSYKSAGSGTAALLAYNDLLLTTSDWQSLWKPKNLSEVAETTGNDWMDSYGRSPIMLDGLPRFF